MNSENPVDTYIVMWDMYGLESIVNVSEAERNQLCQILKGDPAEFRNPLKYMILRAKFNSQRCYEIYSVQSSMTQHELVEIFKSTPQIAAETVRKLGNKIYSDRAERQPVIT